MYTVTSFERRLIHAGQKGNVRLKPGTMRWLAAEEHHGENIGATESHSLFVELKEPRPEGADGATPSLAPSGPR
jgi:hypothetical protein